LLAHLDEHLPVRSTTLAKHLELAASTLSAAIARLAGHGYVLQERDPKDRRVVGLRLSPKGAAAMQASSVLDSARVKRLLEQLGPAERKRALDGLSLLARAAQGSRS
jgi:DNA-binding MarR family transcriptional regulator